MSKRKMSKTLNDILLPIAEVKKEEKFIYFVHQIKDNFPTIIKSPFSLENPPPLQPEQLLVYPYFTVIRDKDTQLVIDGFKIAKYIDVFRDSGEPASFVIRPARELKIPYTALILRNGEIEKSRIIYRPEKEQIEVIQFSGSPRVVSWILDRVEEEYLVFLSAYSRIREE